MTKTVPLLIAGLLLATSASAAERPNLLIITVDDMNADSLGAFGCQLDDTSPNIDRLAAEGMRFDYAHVQVAHCMPSRNVLFSGRYPHNNRVEGFYPVRDADYPAMTDLMKAAGYFTAIRGKVAHSTPYVPYGWDLVLDTLPDGRRAHNKHIASYKTSTAQGIRAAQAAGKPFCLSINIHDPHKPFYAEDQRGETVDDPHVPSRVFTPDEVPIPGFLFDDPVVRKELASYYSSVRRADDCVAAVLEALEESGEAGRTIVVFLSDHGMPLPFAKTQLYHHSTWTPLIVRWPGVTKAGAADRRHMVSAVDFLPTLLDMAGIAHPEGFDGRSFEPLLRGKSQQDREMVFKVYNENAGGWRHPMRAVQTQRLLYIFNAWSNGERVMRTATQGTPTYRRMQELAASDPAIGARLDLLDHRVLEEFYDVENDPDCLANLIDDPSRQAEIARFRETLEATMAQTGDPMLEVFRRRDDPAVREAYLARVQKEADDRRRARRRARANRPNRAGQPGPRQQRERPPRESADAAGPDGRPRLNVVFILADDLGWGELGCYGQEKIPTPHIDRLAAEGMRFTQHYSGAPVCAPARCVLLTGMHTGRAEVRGNLPAQRVFPQFTEGQYPISAESITLAKVFQDAGYVTGAFGKWGLGPVGSSGDPNKQGFDQFFGYNCQSIAHSFYPSHLWRNSERITINDPPVPGHSRQPEGQVRLEDWIGENYAPKLMLEEALKFIEANKSRPFFLYLPFIEPHLAMHPPRESVERFPDEWDDEPYRGEYGYLPHPRPRAGYAAMISDLDGYVGRVIDALDAAGVADHTLVVFTSDNGTTLRRHPEARFHVGGVDAAFFNSTAGLRGYKGSLYEGGIRVPMIARLPDRVPDGAVNDAPSYFADWFPTLCDAAGLEPPEGLDGESLWPTLTGGGAPETRRPMVWVFTEYGGQVAVRIDDFKVIRQRLSTQRPGRWEVYDLSRDRAEANDLSRERTDLIEHAKEILRREVVDNAVFPLTIPDITPAAAAI